MPAPRITDEAWSLLQGACDLQVHVAPDVVERRTDDVDLALDFQRCGLTGFVLKSHYMPTGERAAVVRRAVHGVEAHGSVVLNHGVGGLNPAAVDIAGRSGARIVWFPTLDSINEADVVDRDMPNPPVWVAIKRETMERGFEKPPISIVDDDGKILSAAQDCLRAAMDYDLAVATGHMGRVETFALVEAAAAMGLRHIIVTHAEFPSQNFSPSEQRQLADMGALIEHCFTTAHTGKCTWEQMFENIRETGPERCVISTDLGQLHNPPVAEGFAEFVQRLLDAGFQGDQVRRMTVDNPRQVLGLETLVSG
jgi:hypothetical protein